MIDAKHVHKLLECKYDFKHWIKDVISSFNFKDGIDYISYRYDNNIEYSKGGEVVVVPGTWHGKFKKEWPTEEEKKHIGKNGILNY